MKGVNENWTEAAIFELDLHWLISKSPWLTSILLNSNIIIIIIIIVIEWREKLNWDSTHNNNLIIKLKPKLTHAPGLPLFLLSLMNDDDIILPCDISHFNYEIVTFIYKYNTSYKPWYLIIIATKMTPPTIFLSHLFIFFRHSPVPLRLNINFLYNYHELVGVRSATN